MRNLFIFAIAVSAAFSPAFASEAYISGSCDLFNQIRSSLGPLELEDVRYIKNTDGSFKQVSIKIPNKALIDAMTFFDHTCLSKESGDKSAIGDVVSSLSKIRNNIYDAELQKKIQENLNVGFAEWAAEINQN